VARAETYLHAKFRLDPSNRLATVHERHRQRDRTDRTGQDRQRSDSIRRTVLQTVAQKVAIWAASHNFVRLHIRNEGMYQQSEQQYLLHMFPQYGELRHTNGSVGKFGQPSKFQPISCLGFVTAPTSLNGGQQNFARCLAVSWAGTLYIHFGGSCPLTEFCQLQNSLCVQLTRSPILPTLLHGTRAAAVSLTLWRDTRKGITELSQRAPPIFAWADITLSIGPHSSASRIAIFRIARKIDLGSITLFKVRIIKSVIYI